MIVRPRAPWMDWSVTDWEQHRDHAAKWLLVDPKHLPTRRVIDMCEAHIRRLKGQ